MNVWCCVATVDGRPVSDRWRRRFSAAAKSCTGELDVVEAAGFWGLVGGDAAGRRPAWIRNDRRLAIGAARLDHPSWPVQPPASRAAVTIDLVHLLDAWAEGAPWADQRGDFACAFYDERARFLEGARDAFGVQSLYYRTFEGVVALASRADLLADADAYDRQWLAEFLGRAHAPVGRTPYRDVLAVPPAHTMRLTGWHVELTRYWSPDAFVTPRARPLGEVVNEFHALLSTAVRTRVTPDGRTWAQLSGGLDSSSVVSMAASLARAGDTNAALGGTVTLVDRHGTGGDERLYSDAVIQAHGIRNVQVPSAGWWEADGCAPPKTDIPTPAYLMYARDRRVARTVCEAGGDVLLTGYGADHYLGGSAVFLADWVVHGELARALREATRWAVVGHASFWAVAWQNIVMPLLPARTLGRVLPAAALPTWLAPTAIREFALDERTLVQHAYAGARGAKYPASLVCGLEAMPDVLALHAVIQDEIEERHPFLDRSLVEFALGLPGELCAQPMARKWILREAMRDQLAEVVRTRPGKGSIDGSLAWTLGHETRRLLELIEQPVLGDMGLVDPLHLARAMHGATHGAADERAAIVRTLALECWLQVRSGRWVGSERNDQVSPKALARSSSSFTGGTHALDQRAL